MPNRLGQQLGNYRLVRLPGQGAFAEVYLGEHLYLKSYAALKVLLTFLQGKDEDRFLGEAQVLVRLTHPHIVRVLDYAVEQGTPVLVMDYAPSGTLRQRHPRGS
jgi:serine/threonine protein kinase